MAGNNDGWGMPWRARKAHYFVSGVALCHRWLYAGECHKNLPHPDFECSVCAGKLKKRK